MRNPQFYLGEGEFTRQDNSVKNVNIQRAEGVLDTLYGIDDFVRSIRLEKLPEEEQLKLWRKRTAGQIIDDGFSTGCTDDALVFATIARREGLPTAYVETIEESHFKRLRNPLLRLLSFPYLIEGHVFVDCYLRDLIWPYNPRYGMTGKGEKRYVWVTDEKIVGHSGISMGGMHAQLWIKTGVTKSYIEIARGLDFSQLYTDERFVAQTQLRTPDQIRNLVSRLSST